MHRTYNVNLKLSRGSLVLVFDEIVFASLGSFKYEFLTIRWGLTFLGHPVGLKTTVEL